MAANPKIDRFCASPEKTGKFFIPVGFCLLFFLLLGGSAYPEETYVFKRMWPMNQQDWSFSGPEAVAVDAKGYVYVMEGGNMRVKKYTPDGRFVTIFGGPESGGGQLWKPKGGIAIDSHGYVYVGSGFQGDGVGILKFTSDGQFVMKWGSPGTGDGEFDTPGGIATDRLGYVYVADTYNHRIQKFDANGQFITKWGIQGSEDGQFQYPWGITLDGQGFVYVADNENNRIQKFDTDGQYLGKWGIQGDGDGQLWYPKGIAIDNGHIYVADTGNRRIQKFTMDGQFVYKWGRNGYGDEEFQWPYGIAVDGSGSVYVSDAWNNRIQKFTKNGQLLAKWAFWGAANAQFSWPKGITGDAEGNVYVADTDNHRVQKFTADGEFLGGWGVYNPSHPNGVATDGAGFLYVAETFVSAIRKLTVDGDFVAEWGDFWEPESLFFDSNGLLLIVNRRSNEILKYTSDGQFVSKWGGPGTGDGQFSDPWGIAVDRDGFVYVSDAGNRRIQKFTANGQFVAKWGSLGSGNGEFWDPMGIAVDSNGFVFVADCYNHRIQKFTPDGQFVLSFGNHGFGPGMFNEPNGIYINGNDDLFVADSGNHRIQVFKKVDSVSNAKAIIVAGGGPYPGNNLWDATQASANFAYRALTYQGYTKSTIHYLSSNTGLDLDNNGIADDVDGDATSANLQQAITTWAADAEKLVVYLVDHGGNSTFRMSGIETMSAAELNTWLSQLQQTMKGRVILVYEACESGSFVPALTGASRFVLTSTSPGESAYFVTQGSVSFSNYFWTHVFNGQDVASAFQLANTALQVTTSFQHPLLDADGNGSANETSDFTLTQNAYIGNGTVIHGEAPVIGSISEDQTITGVTSAQLMASGVTDTDGIAKVWAVIRPPDYSQGGVNNPVQELPSIDLLPVGGDAYEGWWHGFNVEGTYQIAIYARDRIGNTSVPKLTTVSVNNPLRRKAIIVAGGQQGDALWSAVEKNAVMAYEALKYQGYKDEDIYFLSPVSFSSGVDAAATLTNLHYGITQWAKESCQDLVLYLTKSGNEGYFKLNKTEIISAETMNSWLDDLQSTISGKAMVIIDASNSGNFLSALTPTQGKERIVISSTGIGQTAHFLSEGTISFSRFFWSRVLNGMNVRDAFVNAKRAMWYCQGQEPQLDDNGNGKGNEKADGVVSKTTTIGTGIMLAEDAPIIGSVSPEQTLAGTTTAEIWVENVTSTGTITRVWAVITPPLPTGESTTVPVTDLPQVELVFNESTARYEGAYTGFSLLGNYGVAVYAIDADSNISLPVATQVIQTVGPDIYEEDNALSEARIIVVDGTYPQTHGFDTALDVDWVKFYGIAGQTYTVEALNEGSGCDIVIQMYHADGTPASTPIDDGITGDGEFYDWEITESGFYYVKVSDLNANSGPTVTYDLKVYRPVGPISALFTGTIINAVTGTTIGEALIFTGSSASAISLPISGNYQLVQTSSGDDVLTVTAEGFASYATSISALESSTNTLDILLVPQYTLSDVMALLQIMAGVAPSSVGGDLDVNGDGVYGMVDLMFMIQQVTGLR